MPARSRRLPEAFFAADTLSVARSLVGVVLRREGCAARIVEVEAYTDDPASHYVTRRPSAGQLMGQTHGRVYVYRIYGVHSCLNFTTDARGPGAVLLRALEPLEGIELMRARRGPVADRDLARGPGRLFAALGLEASLNGRPVREVFELERPAGEVEVATGPRIGISEARELPWRFCLAGSPWLSRPVR